MAATAHSSNAFTEREKKFLMGPLAFIALAAGVFLYVYYTIPSKPYLLQEAHVAAEHTDQIDRTGTPTPAHNPSPAPAKH